MAKVKGPLFSLDARGQIAKSLVYMGWKGLKTVRQYVIPSNPNTADQQTQRNYFKAAVEEWHTDGFTEVDAAAWDLYALALKVAQSGFNLCMKLKILGKVAADTWRKIVAVTIAAPGHITCDVTVAEATEHVTSLFFGTSKTAMFTEIAGVFNIDTMEYDIIGLSPEVVYYFYIKATGAGCVSRTGIYSFKTDPTP